MTPKSTIGNRRSAISGFVVVWLAVVAAGYVPAIVGEGFGRPLPALDPLLPAYPAMLVAVVIGLMRRREIALETESPREGDPEHG